MRLEAVTGALAAAPMRSPAPRSCQAAVARLAPRSGLGFCPRSDRVPPRALVPLLLPAGLWCLGAASVLLANLINNQPMTILLTRACLTPAFAAAASGGSAAAAAGVRRNLRAALFAVVVGSNTAACFSVIGALAGIMWVAIIRQRGVKVSYLRFSALMLPAGVAATVAALLVLWLEFAFAPF